MKWSSEQYLKFEGQRTQPSIDLAGRISLEGVERALDVGCGPGNSSNVLAGRFPQAKVLGIDSSPDMIASARESYPGIEFRLCDAGSELGTLEGGFDVVFSNACIQWIPDHKTLLRNMMALLRPGGVLAVQIPMNQKEPIHRIIGELVTSAVWKDAFPNPRVFYTLPQGYYFDLLAKLSASFTLWETTYYHVMDSHEAILEWYRGTGLRPYLTMLPEARRKDFEQAVLTQVRAQYPLQETKQVIFRFPRFFFTATAKS